MREYHMNRGIHIHVQVQGDDDHLPHSSLPRSILRNRDEHSPIDVEAVDEIESRDARPKIVPVSQEVYIPIAL